MFYTLCRGVSGRIKDWREQGKEGAEVVSKIVAFRSVKSAVEQDHPYKEDFKAKDVKKNCEGSIMPLLRVKKPILRGGVSILLKKRSKVK